jgi:hypothetical protein
MRSKLEILLLSTLLLTSLIGCKSIIIRPIDKADIAVVTKGVAYTSDRDGYFLSDSYMKEVIQAKIDLKR